MINFFIFITKKNLFIQFISSFFNFKQPRFYLFLKIFIKIKLIRKDSYPFILANKTSFFQMRTPTTTMKARPPKTPPKMAPSLLFFLSQISSVQFLQT